MNINFLKIPAKIAAWSIAVYLLVLTITAVINFGISIVQLIQVYKWEEKR